MKTIQGQSLAFRSQQEFSISARLSGKRLAKKALSGAQAFHPPAGGQTGIIGHFLKPISALSAWLAAFYGLCGRTGFDIPATGVRTVVMNDDDVLHLTPKSGLARLEVQRGTIWLTATPATGDVLLKVGDQFDLSNSGEYVIQALEPAAVCLIR